MSDMLNAGCSPRQLDNGSVISSHADSEEVTSASKRQTRLQKRLRESSAPSTSSIEQPATKDVSPLQLSLFIQWYSHGGKARVDQVRLKLVGKVDDLEGISRTLMDRAFPLDERPDYLVSDEFMKFTPESEFMSLPGDIARTQFRLVATHEGWEYVVLEREMGADRDPSRSMLVTLIEFESTAMMLGHLGVRMSLISYPLVSVKKAFLRDIAEQLKTNPDFKGIL